MLVCQYKIEVLDEPQFALETLEQRQKRVLAVSHGGLSLRCVDAIVFRCESADVHACADRAVFLSCLNAGCHDCRRDISGGFLEIL